MKSYQQIPTFVANNSKSISHDESYKNILVLGLIIAHFSVAGQTESPFETVSKKYSILLSTGYNYSNNIASLPNINYALELDYAWQLSGYFKKKKSYLSVPIGLEYGPSDSPESSRSLLLFYGWKVRHDFNRGKVWTPFMIYGLLLNQLWIKGHVGSEIGHQTRFTLGIDKKMRNHMIWTIGIRHSSIRFPSFNTDVTSKIRKLELVTGIRY